MKKIAVIFTFLVSLLFITYVYASVPTDMKINFDPDSKMVNIVITHSSNNTIIHYIRKVEVWLRGKRIIEHYISRQDNDQTQVLAYLIPDYQAGDVISVAAYCSVNGRLERNTLADKYKK